MTKGRDTTYEERIAFVKECIENGYNYTEISEKYKVGYQQIYTWVQKYKKDGEDALKDRRGRHKKDYKTADGRRTVTDLLPAIRRHNTPVPAGSNGS